MSSRFIDSCHQRSSGFMTFVGMNDFDSGCYFMNLAGGVAETAPLWISKLSAFAHPDALCQEFEHGLVLGNPAPHPYTLKTDELFRGRRYRTINNGAQVTNDVTLSPQDGS